ncbi:MAG: DUF6089 family protein [Saprospiraceae bacterium]
MRKWVILLNICLTSYFASAQGTELGILVGGSVYSGDLSPQEFGLYTNDVRLAGGVFARFPIGDHVRLRLGITAGRISSSEKDTLRAIPRPSFQSSLAELALIGEFYPLPYGIVQPYLFGGVAGYRFNPQAGLDGGWIDLQPLGTEGQGLENYPEPYNLTQISLPFGAGVKFVFNETWALGVEFGWRKTFTDYLDDISFNQVTYRDVYEGNGALAAFYSNPRATGPEADIPPYRRGGKHLDWYHVGGVTLSYFIQGGGGGGNWNGKGRRGGRAIGCPTNF